MNRFPKLTIHNFIVPLLILLLSVQLNGQQMITMDMAMDIAAENSPDLKQSRLSLEFNQEKLNAQRARLKSQFALSLSPFQYQKNNRFDEQTSEWFLNENAYSSGTLSINQRILPTDGILSVRNTFSYDYNKTESSLALDPISRTFNNNFSVALTQPIFTYNRTKMELEDLELNYELALLRYLIQKLNMEKNVAQEFYNVYSQQMRLDIAREELENNKGSYETIKNKVDGGLMAREELYQAEVNLATSRSNVYNAEITLENVMDRFKVLIGMPVRDTIVVLARVEADSISVDGNEATELALKNRMELREREIDIEKSMFSIIQAKSTNEFSGSITASYGITSQDEEIGLLFDRSARTPTVGLTLEIPLYDWGERKAEIRAAEANFESAEIDMQKELIDIEVNIRSIVRNLTNLENQIDIQRKTVENAQLTYEINRERYLNGDLTSLDLGIYQDQLSEKKMALTNAIIDFKLELLNLKIQTLYDFENQVSVIPAELLEIEN